VARDVGRSAGRAPDHRSAGQRGLLRLYVGNYQLLGHERPGVSGILTSEINKEQTSVPAHGWFGGVEGQLTLRIVADSPSGQQRLTLRPDGPNRLVGMGDSSFAGARRVDRADARLNTALERARHVRGAHPAIELLGGDVAELQGRSRSDRFS